MTQSGIAELYIALVVVGALVLLLGLFSALIHARLPVSIPLLCLIAGMCLSPAGVGILDPARWGARDTILAEAARLTLAIALMATALRLPPRYFLDHVRLQVVLLGLVMPLMWGLATLLVYLWLGTIEGSMNAVLPGVPTAPVNEMRVVRPRVPPHGFLLPRLGRRLGEFGAAWVMAILWSLWHVAAFFFPGMPHQMMPPLSTLLAVALFGVFLAFMFNRTGGSVLATILAHLSLNIASGMGGVQLSSLVFWRTLVGIFGVLALLIALAPRTRPAIEASASAHAE